MTTVQKRPPVAFFHHFRRASKRMKAVTVALMSLGVGSAGVQAQGPARGVVRAGDARISQDGPSTRIDQASDRAIIDWRSFGIGVADQVIFTQPGAKSATLNRVTGDQVSVILGRLDANGQVLLINPNGVVFGGGAQVNVASLIASTSNISNANFMAGRLVFDEPGRPGAGILNAGAITASNSGLVALVAPHVRNDGVIVARLGTVVLGSADTFTVDLYGDSLINLALSDANVGQLRDANGNPVTSLVANSGHINTAGGQTVLMTARGAKNVLDNLINMSGTIKADTAVQRGGRILLLGEGGKVDVSGTLSATGGSGGVVDVLGDSVRLANGANVDVSGAAGGGAVHVGGAYQGSGDTYRSARTTVDAGATIKANAIDSGDAGEVVVWSDGRTDFSGSIEARGGAAGGNGGRMEVSGKGTLAFLGQVDGSASAGQAGSLLLDPANLDVNAIEAGAITRVLRTGTSTTLAADADINVNSAIYGGDRAAGGGLTMNAGHNINVNDFVVTNDGAIRMNATQGTVNVAPGKALYAGTAPITISAGGTIHTAPMVTSGSLSIQSIAGAVAIDSFIDGHTGPVSIRAAGGVDINQPIVNMSSGVGLEVQSGGDINVNAQVDGRGGATGGSVSMTASRNLNVNQAVVTNNGAMTLTATGGALNVNPDATLLTGTAALALKGGDVTTGASSSGALTIASTAGSVNVNGLIDSATGDTRITSAGDVNINAPVLNTQTGSALVVTAGNDVNVNAQVDGRGGVVGGAATLTAGRNLNLNQFLLTNNGAITLTASTGAATVAAGKGLVAGNAPITMTSAADLTAGIVSGGSFAGTSTAGSVNINGVIDGSTGRVDLNAARDVNISQSVLSPRTGSLFSATAGQNVNVNAQIDGRGGATGGAVTLKAGRDANVNASILTNNAAIGITAAGGAATMASSTALVSGNAPITLVASGDISTSAISGGSLSATSTSGSVSINGVIDGSTGRVDLAAGRDVNFNQPVLNARSGAPLNASAGQNINVNAQIDGSAGAAGGAVNLSAVRDVNVNAAIATNNGAIHLSSAQGTASFASTAGLFAGTGAVSVDTLGNITTGALSGGAMTVNSRGGSVVLGGPIAANGGAITIGAASQVDVSQSIANTGTNSPLTITAGTNINVNAAIDGRSNPAAPSGTVTLRAGGDVNVNAAVITSDASIGVTSTGGAVTMASGTALASGNGGIAVTATGDVTLAGISGGSLSATSSGGTVAVDGVIDASTGQVDLTASRDVNINQTVLNGRSGAALNATAGRDVNVNAQVDGTTGAAGGAVHLTASRDLNVGASISTNNGAISLSSTTGTASFTNNSGLFAGTGAITVNTQGNITTGVLNGGAMTVNSTAGSITVGGQIAGTGGAIAIGAAGQVDITHAITNAGTTSPLTITAGTNINVNAAVGRTAAGVASSSVTLTAGQNLNLNESVVAEDAAISATATNGTVTSGAGKGLFAGTGAIAVQSGQTLNTGITSTTGAVSLRSTAGSVNVATPIDKQTGALTITAATDVNVNQAIRNPLGTSPLTVTAGHDVNVNAVIDGRDNVLAGPSGTITMTAANNVALNDIVATKNSALSVTATNGTVTTAATKGLFAGSGAISVTSGTTLNTGITSTTGALSFRSTNGGVNVNQAIDDTTGAVTINAGTTVNVNQAITNLKSGRNLAITAGTDINVLAQVDGRNGAVAGGTVTMTAGHDLALTKSIATNNGAVSLTATNGAVTMPTGVEVAPVFNPSPPNPLYDINTPMVPMEWIVNAGSAPSSVSSGADFSLTSPMVTTGTLNLTSVNGDVTIAAPISNTTGAVTITAGDALIVNHSVKSADQAITLNAGAGGITINSITDYDYTDTSPVNSGLGNLTLNSVGDVSILDNRGISSKATVTIDTRGRILNGRIGYSETSPGSVRPQSVVLNADGGIVSFNTGYISNSVTATSSGGSITLSVASPGQLRVTTGTAGVLDCVTCDINLSSTAFDASIGADVILNAGGSVNLSSARTTTASLIARSGDVNLLNSMIANQLTMTAGRDVTLADLLWMGGPPTAYNVGGPLTMTAGRDIVTTALSPIHISNAQTLTMVANRNLTLFLLETLGAVNLTSTTGNITLNNDIGPHIVNTHSPAVPDFNASDLGVASLTMSAPAATAAISMQGARAEGNVAITTGGSLTAAKAITSVGGTVSISTGGAQSLHQAVPIGNQDQVEYPTVSAPVVPPGPPQALPTGPGLASNGAAGLPALVEIPVAAANQNVAGVIVPGSASGSVSLPSLSGGGSGGGSNVSGSVGAPGTPGGSGAPGTTIGATGRPGPAPGSPAGQVDVSSAAGTADSASALRATGQACGEESAADAVTGLAAIAPSGVQAAQTDQKAASCSSSGAGQAVAGSPAAPNAPGSPAQPPVPPVPPIAGGVQ